MIETTTVATNRYAPSGADAISLYTNGEGRDLTLAQLVMSVCLRAAATYEAQSVVKMNEMTRGSEQLDTASVWMKKIADGSAVWNEAKAYLTGTLGIDAATLPADISTFDNRMAATTALKGKVDTMTQQQQRQMVDLQTLVNRRDVAYSTSSNLVRTVGNSQLSDSGNF